MVSPFRIATIAALALIWNLAHGQNPLRVPPAEPHGPGQAPRRPVRPTSEQSDFLYGCDASEIPEVEAAGGAYYDGDSKDDPIRMLASHGVNLVRLRVWVNPTLDGDGQARPEGYCGKAQTLRLAKRIKAAGMRLAIDFHYSDWWADPQKQNPPAAWSGLDHSELVAKVYAHTKDVVSALVAQGTPPYFVQPGNEITQGMLWPDGRIAKGEAEEYHRLADFVNAGIRAVRDSSPKGRPIFTAIHIDRGGDPKGAVAFFQAMRPFVEDFDAIGLSYYPFWHGKPSDLKATLQTLASTFHKPVFVAETAYPFTVDLAGRPGGHNVGPEVKLLTGYPATPAGQASYLRLIERIVREVPSGLGVGVLYWAPTWIASPREHSAWENMALFDFRGRVLPGLSALGGS